MRRWLLILLIVLVCVILVVGIVGLYFYNRYEDEIKIYRSVKGDADEIFARGVTGPNECSSFFGCVRHCASNEEECVDFCEENLENELCVLAEGSMKSGEDSDGDGVSDFDELRGGDYIET